MQATNMALTEAELAAERSKHEAWLSAQDGVAGTGIGLCCGAQLCIKIYTHRMPRETREAIERHLDGLPIEFEETGEFEAFSGG